MPKRMTDSKFFSLSPEEQFEVLKHRYAAAKSARKLAAVKRENVTKEETVLTTPVVAKRLGCTVDNVKRIATAGLFVGAFQTEGNHWRIPAVEVAVVAAKLEVLRSMPSVKTTRNLVSLLALIK